VQPATLVRMGRTALITGAWNGIGLELARLFATQGYDLALVARSEGKLSRYRRSCVGVMASRPMSF
jgi:short-subunit dehydrogenase